MDQEAVDDELKIRIHLYALHLDQQFIRKEEDLR